jgi:putative ABC transport system permease protein
MQANRPRRHEPEHPHWVGAVLVDLRHALRSLRSSRGFALVVIAILSVVCAANTATVAFVRALLVSTLPVPEPERLSLICYRDTGDTTIKNAYAYPVYRQFVAQQTAFEGVAARGTRAAALRNGDETIQVALELVSGNYFRVLGVKPLLGRVLVEADEQDGLAAYPIVVSFRLWQDQFGGRRDVLNRVVQLNGRPFQVVGVTSPAFRGAVPGQRFDAQVPLSAGQLFRISLERTTWLRMIARRRNGVGVAQAETETHTILAEVEDAYNQGSSRSRVYALADGSHGFSDLRNRLATPSLMLLAAAGGLLAIAYVNLAGLVSLRLIRRRGEIALRAALGATRARLISQLALEMCLLAAIGSAGGAVLAVWLLRLLTALLNDGGPTSLLDVSVGGAVMGGMLGLSLLAAVLLAAIPSWRASSNGLHSLLRDGAAPSPRVKRAFRRGFMAAQVALSLVLLYGAGLLVADLRRLVTMDLGFNTDNVALVTVDPEAGGYSREAAHSYVLRALERVRPLPDVEAASASSIAVLSGDMVGYGVAVEGFAGSHQGLTPHLHVIAPDYFRTLKTPLVSGRDFQDQDVAGSVPVAVVNERAARLYWPGLDPLGRMIEVDGWRRVVGVVRNSNYRAIREVPPVTVFIPLWQSSSPGLGASGVTFLVRFRQGSPAAAASVRQVLRQLDPSLSPLRVTTLEAERDQLMATERTLALLSSVLGSLATCIAALGIAATVGFDLASRKREMGVRLAIGAGHYDIARLCAREAFTPVGLGVSSGGFLAWAGSQMLASRVPGLVTWDLLTLVTVTVQVAAICSGVVLQPIRRSVCVDPAMTLRGE